MKLWRPELLACAVRPGIELQRGAGATLFDDLVTVGEYGQQQQQTLCLRRGGRSKMLGAHALTKTLDPRGMAD